MVRAVLMVAAVAAAVAVLVAAVAVVVVVAAVAVLVAAVVVLVAAVAAVAVLTGRDRGGEIGGVAPLAELAVTGPLMGAETVGVMATHTQARRMTKTKEVTGSLQTVGRKKGPTLTWRLRVGQGERSMKYHYKIQMHGPTHATSNTIHSIHDTRSQGFLKLTPRWLSSKTSSTLKTTLKTSHSPVPAISFLGLTSHY